jgi:hypothetical protein
MKRFARLAFAAAMFTSLILADQVVLDNGDKVTGKITKKDGDEVSIKSDLMGDVAIKWAHVKSVATDDPVTVVLPGGKETQGKLSTSGDQVQVSGESIPLASVPTVRNAAEEAKYQRYLHPSLFDLWSGYYGLGVADASGNASSLTITNVLNATRITNNDKITIDAHQIYSRGLVNNVVGLTAKAWRAGWTYDRNIDSKRAFVSVFNDYEKDAFQNLNLRVVLGGGVGYHVIKSDRTVFDLVAGASWNHESYSIPFMVGSSATSRDSGEIYWGDDFHLKIGKSSSLTQSYRMFNNLTDTGQFRVNFDLGTDTKINKWLSWQMTGSDRYITNPPPGKKTNDLLLSAGVRISFTQIPQ